ncbi:conserved hypothetical protein [Leishmania major strain Friedlin]|uniref:Uncharacterized protein n=1 Tax=Leishmania major TaxID=5664 RepID=Q4Q589_LEIMA|nr:conserved hypothetical protein [Leishmania major strain Friedlin]CAG9580315.1 hypothetical_protein_-_conserved [Leishmania major strain Friedlin]CAJ08713.1 conserved hypothetical protein [Leishmania major strain Friedlin]|eukprot:XP_001685509.1 conserved hypothetical protein [Leishmania major strain Friedlin]
MDRLASAVLTLAPSRFTDLAHDLVRVHISVKSLSGSVRPQTPSSHGAAEVLTALLSDSRLGHYMKDPSLAPARFSTEETLPGATLVTLHALAIMASAFEASLLAFRRIAAALAQESKTAPPGQTERSVCGQKEGDQETPQAASAWRCESVGEYSCLLTKLLRMFAEELAVVSQPSFPVSHASGARLDLLFLAVLSLMKSADECAHIAGKPSPGDGAATASVGGFRAECVSDQLQHLCLQVSILCSRWSSTAARTLATPGLQLEHFCSTSSLSLVARQAKKLQMRMRVRSPASWLEGYLPALQSMVLVYYVSILRRMIAMESAAVNAACRDAPPSVNAEGVGAQLEGDATASLYLTGDERVQLAKDVEMLWGEIKPKRVLSSAEVSHLQHRTVHTALNVSLATWWKAAAGIAASASSSTPYWNQTPQHITALLCSYNSLLTECRSALSVFVARSASETTALPSASATVSSMSPDLSWFVPFHSRLLRVGLDLQLEATLFAALHLGIEPRAPPTPATPIAKWIESRHIQRLRRRGASGGATTKLKSSETATADASWARVYRLCGGLRVAATELLYCAITDVCSQVAEKPQSRADNGSLSPPNGPSWSQRGSLSPATSANTRDSGSASPLAAALVNAVSRTFFAVPRMQYLFAHYTDATYTGRASEEECRRVYAACLGVLLWLRELAPPFGVRFGESQVAPSVPHSSDLLHGAAPPRKSCREEWQVCGTTSAIAMDGAFFLAYYLYHWPGETGRHAAVSSDRGTEAERTALDVALASDGVVSGMSCPSVAHLLTGATAVEYTKEMLFQLQHDTARQLQHLRATNRLHHFSGELQDKTKLLEDSNLRQRHVTSTLSVVQAHRKQPTLLWMPLTQVQEMVFLFDQYPQLFRCIDSAPRCGTRGDAEENRGGEVAPSDGIREYPKVHVGDITCTFSRVHGYLVKRLHVLSGILREYRSILLESAPHDAIDSHAISNDSSASVTTPTKSSFRGWLLDNARCSPQLAVHRRNNYEWAHVWAMQLHEELPRLPAQMEGAPRWASGVVRTLDRMERTMIDTHQKGLFINVVKSQRQYRELQRARSGAPSPTSAKAAIPADATEEKCVVEPQLHDLVVRRDSERIPLGLVLDGAARILRVQMKVARPAVVADGSDEAEGDLLESPFACALAQQQQEGQHPLGLSNRAGAFVDVVGWRVLRVDGNAVRTGRDVAAQVRDKIEFTVTLQPCSRSE